MADAAHDPLPAFGGAKLELLQDSECAGLEPSWGSLRALQNYPYQRGQQDEDNGNGNCCSLGYSFGTSEGLLNKTPTQCCDKKASRGRPHQLQGLNGPRQIDPGECEDRLMP